MEMITGCQTIIAEQKGENTDISESLDWKQLKCCLATLTSSSQVWKLNLLLMEQQHIHSFADIQHTGFSKMIFWDGASLNRSFTMSRENTRKYTSINVHMFCSCLTLSMSGYIICAFQMIYGWETLRTKSWREGHRRDVSAVTQNFSSTMHTSSKRPQHDLLRQDLMQCLDWKGFMELVKGENIFTEKEHKPMDMWLYLTNVSTSKDIVSCLLSHRCCLAFFQISLCRAWIPLIKKKKKTRNEAPWESFQRSARSFANEQNATLLHRVPERSKQHLLACYID